MNTRAAAILLALTLALTPGCWAATGRPLDLSPQATLEQALKARDRGDDRAFRALLRRITEDAPDSEAARIAQALLDEADPVDVGLAP